METNAQMSERKLESNRRQRLRMLGSGNPAWKGGRFIGKCGYVYITIDGKRRLEHRVVMEGIIGRPLTKKEIVHHKNEVRHDNTPDNLVLTTIGKHQTMHASPVGIQAQEIIKVPVNCGTRHHSSKLSEKIIPDILAALEGGASTVDLGVKYGVHQKTISNIKLGKTWRHATTDKAMPNV